MTSCKVASTAVESWTLVIFSSAFGKRFARSWGAKPIADRISCITASAFAGVLAVFAEIVFVLLVSLLSSDDVDLPSDFAASRLFEVDEAGWFISCPPHHPAANTVTMTAAISHVFLSIIRLVRVYVAARLQIVSNGVQRCICRNITTKICVKTCRSRNVCHVKAVWDWIVISRLIHGKST